MLAFFRKYQRFIFLFTTVMIIASFSFFGTLGEMIKDGGSKKGGEVVCRGVDGSKITTAQVEELTHFISSSHYDFLDDKVSSPNSLNDGVIEEYFLRTPLGFLLAQKIAPRISSEIASSMQKARSFTSYRHPSSPFLTSESLWSQFLPESVQIASSLMLSPELGSVNSFNLLSKAYLEHVSFPSILVKRMIFYQEKQDPRMQPDEGLAYADVSLFGLHSLKEWFGPSYLRSAAQCILQGAAYARSLGLDVSLEEARLELLSNVQKAAKRFSKEMEEANMYSVFLQHVHKMGMEEMQCLRVWREIALFKKLFSSQGEAVIEPLLAQEFFDFAKERALVQVFSFSEDLQLKDFSDLLKLQMYIQAVSSPKSYRSVLDFPKEMLSLQEIEKKQPSLVRRDYILEYAELDIKKASSQIGLKEMWNWQVEEGWAFLQKKFAELSEEAETKEKKYALLDSIEETRRAEIDSFSREKMMSSQEERLKGILSACPLEKATCLISSSGDGFPLKGIKNKKALLELLEGDVLAKKELLSFYTDDQEHYYSFNVIERGEEKRVLTFTEADKAGALREMLDQKLEAIYPDVRKKDSLSYMQKGGGWEPLAKVRDKVGLALFPDLLKSIQAEYTDFYGKEPTLEEKKNPAFYVKNRMIAPLKSALEKCKSGSLAKSESTLSKQWEIQEEIKTLLKSQKEFFPEESLFYLEEGALSPVLVTDQEGGVFFRLLSRLSSEKVSLEDLKNLSSPLQVEGEKLKIQELMKVIETKGKF